MADRIYISIGEMTYYVDTDIVVLAVFALLLFFLLLMIVGLRSLARSAHGKKGESGESKEAAPLPREAPPADSGPEKRENRVCPYCETINSPDAGVCRACGKHIGK